MSTILKIGTNSPEVYAWEMFLVGQGYLVQKEVDTVFTMATFEATARWQAANRIDPVGQVGPQTRAAADKFKIDWALEPIDAPEMPAGTKSLNFAERQKFFGEIAFSPNPVAGNPEGVKITNGWEAKNLEFFEVPQLKGILGAPGSCKIQFNKAAKKQLLGFFQALEDRDLLKHVIAWGGSYNPRFVRGSTTVLSNHAHGTAFDINAAWNGLGVTPAASGTKGSVRELVTTAYEFGFYWGGWGWPSPGRPLRRDGMHFEVMKIVG